MDLDGRTEIERSDRIDSRVNAITTTTDTTENHRRIVVNRPRQDHTAEETEGDGARRREEGEIDSTIETRVRSRGVGEGVHEDDDSIRIQ